MSKNIRTDLTRSPFPQFRHRSAGFILSGFAVSTVVVSAIFWLMYQLVSIVAVTPEPVVTKHGLDFVIVKREETPPEVTRRKPDRPPVVEQPLPQRTLKWASSGETTGISMVLPGDDTLIGPIGGGTIGIGERSYMSLTEIQPNYPERALQRGIEGTCVVVYTISKTGSVKDVRVDESQCSSTLFHSASAKAATKFKYAPRIVDGETIETRNVTKLFRFSITD